VPFLTSFFQPPRIAKRLPLRRLLAAIATGLLASCASPPSPVITDVPDKMASRPGDDVVTPSVILKNKSRWVKADWADLPGVSQDNLNDAWVAWLQSCSRASAANSAICQNVKRLEGQSVAVQRAWLTQTFQPYRVESLQESSAAANGLLTAYYEPIFEASRTPKPGFTVPLYGPPANLKSRSPWFTREEIAQVPAAQNALKGKEIAFIADPIDAMVLHIQGSGRLWLNQSDGRRQQIRLAFAGTNEQPYQSIGRWLLDQNLTKDATWPGIKKWLVQNPKRTQELLAKNPRFVFFKEEPLNGQEALLGPKGAQGVPLTPGRSIAVDPGSIPYGTPVWLASQGPQTTLQRLVLAQDTGSAIQGAVRADFYAGSGDAAGELAGRLKQDMKAWVLLPR
jgi:membrane-bound lytic murein transglycosylase A